LQPYDLEGSVDDLNRPLVRIETPEFTDPLVAFVDTGFNGTLLIDERQAARLGFSVAKNSITRVRLASQRTENFLLGQGSFIWFGERRTILAHVLIETQGERRARNARATEEEILIGTGLLSDCRLEIDFPAERCSLARWYSPRGPHDNFGNHRPL
jgi:predicted aspartyl protease